MSETNIESVSFFSLSNTLRTFLEIMIVDLKKKKQDSYYLSPPSLGLHSSKEHRPASTCKKAGWLL